MNACSRRFVRPACSGRSTEARATRRRPARSAASWVGWDASTMPVGSKTVADHDHQVPAGRERARRVLRPRFGVASPAFARAPHAFAPAPPRADLERRVGSLAEPDVAQVLHRQVVVGGGVGRRREHQRDRLGRLCLRASSRAICASGTPAGSASRSSSCWRASSRARLWNGRRGGARGPIVLSRAALVSDARQDTFTTIDENAATASRAARRPIRRCPRAAPRARRSTWGANQLSSTRSSAAGGSGPRDDAARACSASLRERERSAVSVASSGVAQRTRATRTAIGERSAPKARRPAARASSSVVPPPQTDRSRSRPERARRDRVPRRGACPRGRCGSRA